MKKVIFICLVILFNLGVFMLSKNAEASVIYSQTIADTGYDSLTNAMQIANATLNPYGGSYPLPTSSIMTYIKVQAKASASCIANEGADDINFQIYNSAGTPLSGTTGVTYSELNSASYTEILLTLTSPIDLASTTIETIDWNVNPVTQSTCYGATQLIGNDDGINGPNTWANSTPHIKPYIIIYDAAGEPTGGQIEFAPQNFQEGMITPDFENWWLLVTPQQTGRFNWVVNWGTSTPDVWENDFASEWGYFNLEQTEVGQLVALVKTPTSTPGSYVAQASLYYYNGSTEDLVDTSDVLHFTISTGSIISLPPSIEDFGTPDCQDTNFSILGADFGRGICRVARFLFVPGQSALNQWVSLRQKLDSRIPFSYVVQTIDFVTSFTPSSTSSVPSLTISTGTSTPIHVSAEVFSTSTLTRFIGTTRMAQLRSLMSLGIYLSFATAMYFSIKHLLR